MRTRPSLHVVRDSYGSLPLEVAKNILVEAYHILTERSIFQSTLFLKDIKSPDG